ncbi:MAG: hypothetical protein LAN84_01940 [Acidobacteriia bacterium]|nr:hypothetical protein [Terriglobia bacterium]
MSEMQREGMAAGSVQLLQDWRLQIDVDMVLRGQGADAGKMRARNARAVAVAEKALREGMGLLDPRVAYRRLAVHAVRHERVLLEGGGALSGPLVTRHLGGAQWAVVAVATIGARLEARISETLKEDRALGLALDGLGTAAVEALAAAACGHFDEVALREELRSTTPLSPGMSGWKIEAGQKEIFGLLDGGAAGVRLSACCLMTPRKSLSLVVGLGKEVRMGGEVCDFCGLRETCRHRKQYEALAQAAREK